ncbi:hypothetical protein WME97_22605 [Sorangium sp. So ce367]|uniref:hypothetical protein n=1 Tax=Sorangium sp. So ce367 TaxID=3133305 RepID=UPI003F5E9505
MTDSLNPYQDFAACHPKLREAVSEVVAYWEPDSAPVTVVFGRIGRALVQLESDLDDVTLDEVSRLVERSLSGSGPEADAVATGLLEAICAHSVDAPAAAARVVSHLGPDARAYIRAWDAFTGTTTPGVT